MARIIIDDRPWEMLTDEEKNEKWMREYGEPYKEPTEAELEEIKRKYGIKD